MEGKAGIWWVYANTSQMQIRIWARLTWGFCPVVEKMIQCQWCFWGWKSSVCLLMSKMSCLWTDRSMWSVVQLFVILVFPFTIILGILFTSLYSVWSHNAYISCLSLSWFILSFWWSISYSNNLGEDVWQVNFEILHVFILPLYLDLWLNVKFLVETLPEFEGIVPLSLSVCYCCYCCYLISNLFSDLFCFFLETGFCFYCYQSLQWYAFVLYTEHLNMSTWWTFSSWKLLSYSSVL